MGFPDSSVERNSPANTGDAGLLSQKDPLEKEMVTHSCLLAWEIPRTEEPGRWATVPGVAKADAAESEQAHAILLSPVCREAPPDSLAEQRASKYPCGSQERFVPRALPGSMEPKAALGVYSALGLLDHTVSWEARVMPQAGVSSQIRAANTSEHSDFTQRRESARRTQILQPRNAWSSSAVWSP